MSSSKNGPASWPDKQLCPVYLYVYHMYPTLLHGIACMHSRTQLHFCYARMGLGTRVHARKLLLHDPSTWSISLDIVSILQPYIDICLLFQNQKLITSTVHRFSDEKSNNNKYKK